MAEHGKKLYNEMQKQVELEAKVERLESEITGGKKDKVDAEKIHMADNEELRNKLMAEHGKKLYNEMQKQVELVAKVESLESEITGGKKDKVDAENRLAELEAKASSLEREIIGLKRDKAEVAKKLACANVDLFKIESECRRGPPPSGTVVRSIPVSGAVPMPVSYVGGDRGGMGVVPVRLFLAPLALAPSPSPEKRPAVLPVPPPVKRAVLSCCASQSGVGIGYLSSSSGRRGSSGSSSSELSRPQPDKVRRVIRRVYNNREFLGRGAGG